MKIFTEDPRENGSGDLRGAWGGVDWDAAVLALALLSRDRNWRRGEGRVLVTVAELDLAEVELKHSRVVLMPCDNTGRDSSTPTHFRVDLHVQVPK